MAHKSLPPTAEYQSSGPTRAALGSSSSHPSSLLSELSSPSCPSSSSSSSQNYAHRGKKLTATLNHSEIRIRHEDIDEEDEDVYDVEDRRASSVWAAPGPSSASTASLSQQQHQHAGLGLASLEDSEENSLLDMLGMGTREAEVGTPPVGTLDDDVEGDDDNSTDGKTKDCPEEASRLDGEVEAEDWKQYWGSADGQ